MTAQQVQYRDLKITLSAATPRCCVIMLTAADLRFTLAQALPYVVTSSSGTVSSHATRSAVVLDDLTPDTAYEFHCAGQVLSFVTPHCAGLIEARDFGLFEEAKNNAVALMAAIQATPKGGTLRIPKGRFVTGPLDLKSDMTLHLCKGATLVAPVDRGEYAQLEAYDPTGQMLGSWEGLPDAMFKSLITAVNCTGLSVAGRGTLDGGGAEGDWWTWPKDTREGARRPRTIYAVRCEGLTLAGITIRNSPSWTVHPVLCDNAVFSGLTIWNPSDSPNTDGLNPEMCRNGRLEGIHFSVGDDCIAIKAGKRSDAGDGAHLAATSHLKIQNCRMERGHGAVVMGSEMSGSITDITISHCEFVGTDRGLRIKSRRGRGGEVARILCHDCTMDGVETALAANAYYYCDWDGHSDAVQNRAAAPVTDLTPRLYDITLRDCDIRGLRLAVAAVIGLSEQPITGLKLANITYTLDPNAKAAAPLMADYIPLMRHQKLWSEFADVSCSCVTEIDDPAMLSASTPLSQP
ncbi:polygalacturonase [Pacificibacter maritimus]|uniref:Polygalacturonase n=1 Tax=Pacificibacter maritimus TaxID=762213 RepID=A0A3N4UVW4_9RHOB|nr:glycoside hydrolase family 28 protein [Pacificibacter maritimus]RPE71661.1 polygalacturonase [Pacificibacter maritimus]